MTFGKLVLAAAVCGGFLLVALGATGDEPKKEAPTRAERYMGIPKDFDFPADRKTLETFRDKDNVAEMRKHAWMVFAGMTQPAPGGEALWETWYNQEDETFAAGQPTGAAERSRDSERVRWAPPAAPRGLRPSLVSLVTETQKAPDQPAPVNVHKFRQPEQMKDPTGRPIGDSLLAFVVFNREAHQHIRDNHYYQKKELDRILKDFKDRKVKIEDRHLKDFPSRSVIAKAVWWHVKKDGLTALPMWDFEPTQPIDKPNGITTWKRVVAIDPSGEQAGKQAEVTFNKTKRQARVVALKDFYHFRITKEQLPSIKEVLGEGAEVGDYAVLVGMHATTKEIPNWVWMTFWWHDRPTDGPFAADRPDKLKGVWRNFLMDVSYSMETPKETNGTPKVCYNPWLEASFPNGTLSNCMTCHQRALWPQGVKFVPISRGQAKPTDAMFENRMTLDFMWSINLLGQ